MKDLLLEVQALSKSFGGLKAIDHLSFQVQRGDIKSIIGPNGAGKTTLFNLITAIHEPTAGKVVFEGQSLEKKKPHQIARLGISRTFQTVELFSQMTVLENVMVGFHLRTSSGIMGSGLRWARCRREEKMILEEAQKMLVFGDLVAKAHLPAGSLPFGEQKRLEVLRALATKPKLLLMDEPAAGLNEVETEKMAETIYEIRESGVTVVLVEHDMSLVMKVSDEILVLNYGQKIAEGQPQAIQQDRLVIEAYLGAGAEYA
jgi:branched-chain amino acid transport system ATP-binding protein